MNNQNIKDLPPIERLAEYRRQNPSPVWNAKPIKKAPAASIAGLNPNNPVDCLTAARLGHTLKPKPKAVAEEYAPRGAFVAGEGFVWFNDED
ncbi:MAG: hypothetical protein Q7T96_01615 [Methylobacter sp.]|nr:hypothetical protein [Methylobacter sp.]